MQSREPERAMHFVFEKLFASDADGETKMSPILKSPKRALNLVVGTGRSNQKIGTPAQALNFEL
jgi:hypothetical protein